MEIPDRKKTVMIGIIVLNYMNWEDTLRCVQSIHASESNPGGPEYRVYVVDNSSPLQPSHIVSSICESDNAVCITSKENVGYAAGNNLGIHHAVEDKCDEILIANNDIIFQTNCIRNLYRYLKENPDVGIVGPKIINAEGKVQKSCLCQKTSLKEKYLVRTRLNVLFRKRHRRYFGLDRDYEKTFSTYAVHGSCFMISKQCVRDVFPFDEGTFLYEEEYIVGIRMENAGYKTHYVPKGVVCHLEGQSTSEVKPFSYCCETVSELYYCRKYLHAKNYQIYPLFLYRKLKYDLKCIKNGKYRKYRKEFRRKIKDAWKGKYIHNA